MIRVMKSRRIGWVEYVARMEEMRNAYRVLARKLDRKRLFERCRRTWEDNIKMDFK
jgi:hypothetical protein